RGVEAPEQRTIPPGGRKPCSCADCDPFAGLATDLATRELSAASGLPSPGQRWRHCLERKLRTKLVRRGRTRSAASAQTFRRPGSWRTATDAAPADRYSRGRDL